MLKFLYSHVLTVRFSRPWRSQRHRTSWGKRKGKGIDSTSHHPYNTHHLQDIHIAVNTVEPNSSVSSCIICTFRYTCHWNNKYRVCCAHALGMNDALQRTLTGLATVCIFVVFTSFSVGLFCSPRPCAYLIKAHPRANPISSLAVQIFTFTSKRPEANLFSHNILLIPGNV